jgi:hypothetical protein
MLTLNAVIIAFVIVIFDKLVRALYYKKEKAPKQQSPDLKAWHLK